MSKHTKESDMKVVDDLLPVEWELNAIANRELQDARERLEANEYRTEAEERMYDAAPEMYEILSLLVRMDEFDEPKINDLFLRGINTLAKIEGGE